MKTEKLRNSLLGKIEGCTIEMDFPWGLDSSAEFYSNLSEIVESTDIESEVVGDWEAFLVGLYRSTAPVLLEATNADRSIGFDLPSNFKLCLRTNTVEYKFKDDRDLVVGKIAEDLSINSREVLPIGLLEHKSQLGEMANELLGFKPGAANILRICCTGQNEVYVELCDPAGYRFNNGDWFDQKQQRIKDLASRALGIYIGISSVSSTWDRLSATFEFDFSTSHYSMLIRLLKENHLLYSGNIDFDELSLMALSKQE